MGNIDSRNERFYNLCGLGKAHLIEKMLESDRTLNTINVNWVAFETQSTPLLIASANGHDLVVDVLLRNNAKIAIKDAREATALHHAAQRGYTEIAKKLLHAGSDVNARDKLGWTPLMKACYFCNPDIILTLLEAGAEIDAETEQGRTALHELCRSPPRVSSSSSSSLANNGNGTGADNEATLAEIACMLIEAGADVNKTDHDHFTPLMYAAYHNHPSVALVLLESNCAINKTDKQGWTALHWGIDRDHPEIVQLLIDKGARTDILSRRGESAASRAKSLRVKDIVKHIKRYSTLSLSLTDMNNLLHHDQSSPLALSPTELEKLKKFTSSMSMTNVENSKPLKAPMPTISSVRAMSSTDV